MGWSGTFQPKKRFTPRLYSPPTRDPNAMDVDQITIARLTPDQCTQYMKEGRCFRCSKIGHVAKDHDGNTPYTVKSNDSNKKFDGVKKTAHTTRAMIRNLVADLGEEDKKEIFDGMMKDADF